MTSEQILREALTAVAGEPTNRRTAVILEAAIVSAMVVHKSEVLDAFNEGENQGFASGSLYDS